MQIICVRGREGPRDERPSGLEGMKDGRYRALQRKAFRRREESGLGDYITRQQQPRQPPRRRRQRPQPQGGLRGSVLKAKLRVLRRRRQGVNKLSKLRSRGRLRAAGEESRVRKLRSRRQAASSADAGRDI